MKYTIAVLLVVLSCRDSKLLQARDPQCDTPCYGGVPAEAGKGVCVFGKWSCDEQGKLGDCKGWEGPRTRICNGQDNDCDGKIDSTVVVCETICGMGLQTCDQGRLRNDCTARKPIPEICDGLDNDCDNEIDEIAELPLITCYSGDAGELLAPFGDCHPGIEKCERGHPVCRNDKAATPERCDNVDNNCNGAIDENLTGCMSVTPGDFRMVLTWDRNNDMDAHLLHPDAGDSHGLNWGSSSHGFDCFYANTNPSWDSPVMTDDPKLDHDDTTGTGPETVTIPTPVIGQKYTIGVLTYNFSYLAPTTITAEVKVYCNGVLATTQSHVFTDIKDMWVVGTIEFDSFGHCAFVYDGFDLH